jgi:hypothetical protein
MLFGCGPSRRIQLRVGRPQIFLETGDGVLIPMVLFEATTLVEYIGRVLGVDEQICQDINPFAEVAAKARLSGGALLGLFFCREDGRGRKRYKNESDRRYAKQGIDEASKRLAHSGESWLSRYAFASISCLPLAGREVPS